MDGRYITLGRLGDIAGISPRTLYRLARAGRLPGVLKIGRSLRFDLNSLEALTRPAVGPHVADPTEEAAS